MPRLCAFALVVTLAACSDDRSPSPFLGDSGADADAADVFVPPAVDSGVILGGPCLEDSQCQDGVDCTFDSCNLALRRCQFVVDDMRCQNDTFCDGVERCDPVLGCRPGPREACSDESACTIDSCVEATKSCEHAARDADGDGNPDGHCIMGGDCDDRDPAVFVGHPEVCANQKDDNCDGEADEKPCRTPSHDTCLDPLLVEGSGTFELDATASLSDYSGSCAPMDGVHRRDVVAAIQVTGSARDVDVVAEIAAGTVAVGLVAKCGESAAPEACASALLGPQDSRVARIRVRGLEPGVYPLYVWSDRDGPIVLHVTYGPKTSVPVNETCGSAAPLSLGQRVTASLLGTKRDLASRCHFETGDLVYSFTLAETRDVVAVATALDPYGAPVVSLRRADCTQIAGVDASSDEIACGGGPLATAVARSLPKGTYYLAVSATAPTDVEVRVEASPPTKGPADETCAGAPILAANRTLDVDLGDHTDDIDLVCGPAQARDAAYALELTEPSDVLLVMRMTPGDSVAVALASPSCDAAAAKKVCGERIFAPAVRDLSAVRAGLRGAAAGSYRVVAESARGNPAQLTAFVRKAVPPSLVPFADTCATAVTIAEGGGFYQGNTANAAADYSAGCDSSGGGNGGAPDQMLKLALTARKRVIFDMQGSAFATLLDVRKGDPCPGVEVPNACSVGRYASRSYLDLTLDPGTYWIQVDGFGGEQGTWFLDVRVVPP
ncbi:MAG TPA: putative metal-binding motif-containing protein, partial [Polyangiaceae bacterium]|nr:putative metal-binding motif-containing protein [Polyangiaceae bacterium]